jgi:predicted PurR-regulated permease PerM
MGSSPLRLAAAFCGMVVLLLLLWVTRSIVVTVFIALLFAAAIMPNRNTFSCGLGRRSSESTLVSSSQPVTARHREPARRSARGQW